MGGIFISYRREDTASAAGRLCDALEREFGREQIFRDVETIEPGIDFVVAIDRALSSCCVMLVIIGPRWLTLTDRQGQRRVDSPYDWVRVETGRALARGIRVIPVLVDDAVQIVPGQVPPDLQALAVRQSHELSDKRWDYDVQQLVAVLARIPGIHRTLAPRLGDILGAAPKVPTSRSLKFGLWIAGFFVVSGVAAAIGAANLNQANQQTINLMNQVRAIQPANPDHHQCGCWGFVNQGDNVADQGCASGRAVVQPCPELLCIGGTLQWRLVCLR